MYASANTKTKINQGVPALVPLGDAIWEKGTNKEDITGSSGSGSSATPLLVHLEPRHTTNNAGDCVPSFGKTEINKRRSSPSGISLSSERDKVESCNYNTSWEVLNDRMKKCY